MAPETPTRDVVVLDNFRVKRRPRPRCLGEIIYRVPFDFLLLKHLSGYQGFNSGVV